MVVYRGTQEASPCAIYFDSEGHTIRYDVQVPVDGGGVVFVSGPGGIRATLSFVRGCECTSLSQNPCQPMRY